ncbi:activator of s-phase kinase-related [Anaeramoeba flamelloides]|uniref:Activator of s-phase kinase-related n=1 Tax=Anaeramoeba flamelloides TaxID=1746091 RepID=A0ABQ8XR22_9EUKA|nr:activator of s-phase kinase-related [Anaeramoeba flamelloides]
MTEKEPNSKKDQTNNEPEQQTKKNQKLKETNQNKNNSNNNKEPKRSKQITKKRKTPKTKKKKSLQKSNPTNKTFFFKRIKSFSLSGRNKNNNENSNRNESTKKWWQRKPKVKEKEGNQRSLHLKSISQLFSHPMKGSGNCRICQVKYCDLDKHIQTEKHRIFAQTDDNYKDIDLLLQSIEIFHKHSNEKSGNFLQKRNSDSDSGSGSRCDSSSGSSSSSNSENKVKDKKNSKKVKEKKNGEDNTNEMEKELK